MEQSLCVPVCASGVENVPQCRQLTFRLLTLHFPAALSSCPVHRTDPGQKSPAVLSHDGEGPGSKRRVPRVSLGLPALNLQKGQACGQSLPVNPALLCRGFFFNRCHNETNLQCKQREVKPMPVESPSGGYRSTIVRTFQFLTSANKYKSALQNFLARVLHLFHNLPLKGLLGVCDASRENSEQRK